jgi:replicative DNA helicase
VVDAVRDDLLTVTGTEPIEAILSRVENPILDISSLLTGSGQGPRSMGDGVREYVGHLAANQRDVVGIPSGFRKYDQAIGGGFRPGTVNCIGARPKVGKTLLGMNVGVRVASGAGYDWPASTRPRPCRSSSWTRR